MKTTAHEQPERGYDERRAPTSDYHHGDVSYELPVVRHVANRDER
jgi:hypothetical protein